MPRLSPGCLGVRDALAAGEAGRTARDAFADWRNDGWFLLRERFLRAAAAGDLPQTADPGLLARHIMTVANGIAVQAAGGVCRDDLQQVADAALRNWPLA